MHRDFQMLDGLVFSTFSSVISYLVVGRNHIRCNARRDIRVFVKRRSSLGRLTVQKVFLHFNSAWKEITAVSWH
jgi:hypothetical protein